MEQGNPKVCAPCGGDLYSFYKGAEAQCNECDEHAECTAGEYQPLLAQELGLDSIPDTILVPKESFWHSRADRPNIVRCKNKKACKLPSSDEEYV